MLADYTLQTNWLVARKGQAWDGLALHGLMVFFMSMLVLPQYAGIVLLPILGMSLLHTAQDWLKIYLGPRLKIHPIYSYSIDQLAHYTTIVGMQGLLGAYLLPPPTTFEVALAATGASVITLTRFYDVTWWANWLDMIPYMTRWRNWGYLERLAMFALSVAGLFYLAPLCAGLRLFEAWRCKRPIWKQPRGLLEMGLGILLAVTLGVVVRGLLPLSMR